MGRISAEEKENATLIPLNSVLSGDDDTEAAFRDFRASFDTGEEPGVVRAWKLQIDERGNIGTTKAQTRLGSWPADAYTFDELCQLLVNEFMEPGSEMAVRLVGTSKEQTGYKFNKIVMLKRGLKKESSSNAPESTASIMKMMQEMNERNMQLITKLQAPPAEKPDVMSEIQKMMAFAQAMNAPMMGMLQSLLPALAGRPAPPASADPFGNISGLLDVAERISDLKGGGGESAGDGGFADILRAITPLAKPALEALPAIAAMQANSRPAPRIIPAPVPPPKPIAIQTSKHQVAPTPAPAVKQPDILLTDLPSEDANVLAQLKPQIDSLVAMAQQGSDPTGAADFVYEQILSDDRLSEEDFSRLADFVDSDSFVNHCKIINPAVQACVPWFETFKIQIVKRLDADNEPETSETGLVAPGQ